MNDVEEGLDVFSGMDGAGEVRKGMEDIGGGLGAVEPGIVGVGGEVDRVEVAVVIFDSEEGVVLGSTDGKTGDQVENLE